MKPSKCLAGSGWWSINMDESIKGWLEKIELQLKESNERGIRVETKLDSYIHRTDDLEKQVNELTDRVVELEKQNAELRGIVTTVRWLGGIATGLILIIQGAIMWWKN